MAPDKLMNEQELELALSRSEQGTSFIASYGMAREEAEELLSLRRENERMASALREIYFIQRMPENAFAECVSIAARGLGEQQHKHSVPDEAKQTLLQADAESFAAKQAKTSGYK